MVGILLASGAASALPAAEDTSCNPGLVALLPSNLQEGLPPEVVITGVFDARGCGAPRLDVSLTGAAGEVPVTVVDAGDGVVRAIPDAPLAEGEYVAEVTAGFEPTETIRFTVGGEPLPPPPVPEVAVDAERSCAEVLTSEVLLTAAFPPEGEGTEGILRARITTEQGLVSAVTLPYQGRAEVVVATTVFGGREVCGSLAMEDLTGATVWETDPVCAAEHPGCPAAPDGVEAGGGCRTAPAGGWLALGLLPLLLRRRPAR